MDRDPLFQFRGLEMYTAGPDDLWLARLWKSIDVYHQDTPPEYWLNQSPGVESYLMRDRHGWLFFFQLQHKRVFMGTDPTEREAVEVHMQFAPVAGRPRQIPDRKVWSHRDLQAGRDVDANRIMRALGLGLEWLEMALRPRGIEVLFFETENPGFLRFAQKRLGFAPQGRSGVKRLYAPPEAKENLGNVA